MEASEVANHPLVKAGLGPSLILDVSEKTGLLTSKARLRQQISFVAIAFFGQHHQNLTRSHKVSKDS